MQHESPSLSSTTIHSLGSVVAVKHGLQFGPSSPQDKPAWVVIAFAVLRTSEAGQGQEELLDWHWLTDFPIPPDAEDIHVVRRQEGRRWPTGWCPA